MAANKNKERDAEWRRDHNRRYVADINKSIATPFSNKLKNEGKAFQAWLREQMIDYLSMKG